MFLLAELSATEWTVIISAICTGAVSIIGAVGTVIMLVINAKASDRRAEGVKQTVAKASEIQTVAAAGDYAKASELQDSLAAEISNPTKRIKS